MKTEGEEYSECEIKNNPQSKVNDLKSEIERLKKENSDLTSTLEKQKELLNEKDDRIKQLETNFKRQK